MKNFIKEFLRIGEGRYQDDLDKRRVHIYNFMTLGFSVSIVPLVIVVSIINHNSYSLYTTIGFYGLTLVGLILNWKGHNQIAVIGLAVSTMAITYFSLKIVPYQTGAPYGNLLIALVSLLMIKNRLTRLALVAASILSFIVINYLQLKYKSFDETEFLPIIMVIVLMFIALLYYDNLMTEARNRIKSQGQKLLVLEKEKHQKVLDLKQKDLESTLAIFSVKDQITTQITKKLRDLFSSSDVRQGLHRLIIDLQNQNQSIKAKTLISQNIDVVNSDFYKRLMERFPTLTKGDRELCALLKINLTNKEIAHLKNTTDNSVNVSKARLRKKLCLDSNRELTQFLSAF